MVLPKVLWAQQMGHNYPNTQKVDQMVGKNLISGLLTVLKHQVYALDIISAPKVGTGTILSSPRTPQSR